LDHEQIVKGESGEATVGGVADATRAGVTIGGAQDADRGGVPALDFEVDGVWRPDGYAE